MKYKKTSSIIFFSALCLFAALSFLLTGSLLVMGHAQDIDDNERLKEMLRMIEEDHDVEVPLEQIYRKGEVLFCTGQGRAARENNRAAELIQQGEYQKASEILKNALKERALFFPFRYNLGISYVHLKEMKKALLNLEKAKLIVPEFSYTYLQIGYIYQQWNRDYEAIEHFREALRRNTKEIETFVLIGDVYYKRNQLEMAQKYYDSVLRIDHLYPNGLLGRAKIFFQRGQYIKAIVMLKSIDTSRDYNKSLHYYFAESAFKLRDYKTAAEHYAKLLSFPEDRFFLVNSPALIKHKLEISRRIAERE